MQWKEINGKLITKIEFSSQMELANFFIKVANLADNENHHPDIAVEKCSILTIILTTHDAAAITEKDYDLSNKIDALYCNWKKT